LVSHRLTLILSISEDCANPIGNRLISHNSDGLTELPLCKLSER
jgi:hypothetical protein